MWHQKDKKNKLVAHHCQIKPKKNYFYILLLILIIIFLISLFIYQSKYLVIKQIIINSDNEFLISKQEIQNYIQELMSNKFLLYFHQNTLLTLSNKKIKKKLLNDSRIEKVTIIKKIPDKLIINISETKPIIRLSIFGDKDYLLSSDGRLISVNLDILRRIDLPLISDKTKIKWQDPQLSKIIKIASELLQEQNILNDLIILKIAQIEEDEGILMLKIITNEGWAAYFVLQEDINRQISNLRLVLGNQLSNPEQRKGLEYIDLRFGNRIYYK